MLKQTNINNPYIGECGLSARRPARLFAAMQFLGVRVVHAQSAAKGVAQMEGIHHLHESEIIRHVLQNRLGMILDHDGLWLSKEAIASLMGREPGTVGNRLATAKRLGVAVEEHPAGGFWRLDSVIHALAEGRKREKAAGENRRRKFAVVNG